MVKRWLTPQTRSHQEWHNQMISYRISFFLKIQHVYGQKMIDLVWQTPHQNDMCTRI